MPRNILHIDASARMQDSVSRALSARIVAHFAPERLKRRDLADGPAFIDESFALATFTPPEDRTAEQSAALALSDALVGEVQAADTIVIGTPIYNFFAPAALKAWIDQVARAGVTFAYGDNGPEGKLTGKRAIIAVASGGTKIGGPGDHATPYLRHMLGFLGITDVTFVDTDSIDDLLAAA